MINWHMWNKSAYMEKCQVIFYEKENDAHDDA